MIRRWNEKTKRYEPFEAGARTYPKLPAELELQLAQVTPSVGGKVVYFPCAVALRDGTKADRTVIVDAASYISQWGIWPDQDAMKREVMIGDVVKIGDCSSRLPPQFAKKLYEAGESGMGYQVFEIGYRSGPRSAHFAGNLIDFVELPAGRRMSDVIDVYPHKGRNKEHLIPGPDFFWCLTA